MMLHSISSRLTVIFCQADSSSTNSQVEHYWRISAAKPWNPQSQDDVSVVSCKVADNTLQRHFWIVKKHLHRDRVQFHNSKHTDLCEIVIALITTDINRCIISSSNRRKASFCNIFVTDMWRSGRFREDTLHKYMSCRREKFCKSLAGTAYS